MTFIWRLSVIATIAARFDALHPVGPDDDDDLTSMWRFAMIQRPFAIGEARQESASRRNPDRPANSLSIITTEAQLRMLLARRLHLRRQCHALRAASDDLIGIPPIRKPLVMNDKPLPLHPVQPGARQTKTSDALLMIGVVLGAFALSMGVTVFLVEITNMPAMGDWAIARSIGAIPGMFPANKAPANVWDLSQSLPFAFTWLINKIALVVSLILFLAFVGAAILPALALTAALVYPAWRFHFKARLDGGSLPVSKPVLQDPKDPTGV